MKPARAAPRRRSREAALQVLFAFDLNARSGPVDPELVFAEVDAHFELPPGARSFAAELVQGVSRTREGVDAALAEHSRNWRISRMPVVDRNILRLAAYELIHTETPVEVVIDEAVELAARYADERSPGFVNGVLDALARSVRS